ncbi:arf-GAP with Rho-GAP domain, ANK repeat and PH domain-containing protein 2 [Onthophagus taurus]|uniref:arf-GAP with Rho-GAP domain, ANK repeat and PH domain-containing protein 2 n=1 Tax=Onthophagus taurus TaxID=166361 RepID=UPI000C20BEF0|nr:arf-GAP with Rho-GAP domain, ANK repeat and PH domain-containing protein 2 isoform X1 [Onthophagus taurus]XP_022910067.1 arf-GAP with Rho-GAP domain, ANK repeat and PH domain-containing protein 2 isoform X2 [Onthophagus taurus]
MSAPIPAPRNLGNNETKKPIPAPRQLIPIRPSRSKDKKKEQFGESLDNDKDSIKLDEVDNVKNNDFNSNTFTRRVRTLSNASKQIAEDIGGKVLEGKKAVIESTRTSVRRITKRFHSNNNEQNDQVVEEFQDIPIGIFDSITFNSPINSIYSELDDYNSPPPPYPPPALPEEHTYDAPQSLTSGSTSSNEINTRNDYESVFPAATQNSDSESYLDVPSTDSVSINLNRSDSWRFYDEVPPFVQKTEQIYNNIDSTPSLAPENASICSGTMRTNSIYENHEIETRCKDETHRVAESVILQFDPLRESTYANEAAGNEELLNLERLLLGDLCETVTPANTIDDWSCSTESDIEEYINPPAPPERHDSLPSRESSPLPKRKEPAKEKERESKTNWYTSDNVNINSTPTASTKNSKLNLLKHVNDVLKKAPQLVRGKSSKDSYLARPSLNTRNAGHQRGLLYKVTNGPVEDLFGEFNSRWCTLEGQLFLCHTDNTCNTIKENFPMVNILSIQLLEDQKYKYKYDNEDIHCFELNTSGKSRGGHIYGSKSQSERRLWMQKLAESLTSRFGSKVTSDYQRMGWAYVREGVSGHWTGAWIVLSGRFLHYALENSNMKCVDLRKARCIILQQLEENDHSPKTTDKGPNLLVDSQSGSVYFRMWTGRETKVWCHIIRLAAHDNGLNLDQQQLTKNDVPVIVEKCINFIYVYGSMAKGIYRCAGSSSHINDILTQFRTDAWSTQLTPDKYTEHDVATALKRFFRDLPEPLIMKSKQQYFYQVSKVRDNDERIRMYRAVFDAFPKVFANTIRILLGHLNFIVSQCNKNLMDLENISSVWGMTLMKSEVHALPSNEHYTNKDSELIADLILLYRDIFPENQRDIEKERLMLSVLERYNNQVHTKINNTKVTGEFRIWIYLNSKQGKTYNVAIGPQKTAYQVCAELSSKIQLPVDKLQLEELVLNENLHRPIHYTEKVLDVVLKWGYWDDSDRKDNCLILSPISKYAMYISDKIYPVSGELKYADSKSKNFRSHMFDLRQAKLSYYKDHKCINVIESWKIEDLTWYFGHEPKRNNIPSKHVITFLMKDVKPNRTKSSPFFGNVIAWQDEAFLITWISSMWRSSHPHEFLPPPQHVAIIDS